MQQQQAVEATGCLPQNGCVQSWVLPREGPRRQLESLVFSEVVWRKRLESEQVSALAYAGGGQPDEGSVG